MSSSLTTTDSPSKQNNNNNNNNNSSSPATIKSPEESAMLGVLSKRVSVDAASNISATQIYDAKYHKVQARRLYASTFDPWRRMIHEFVFHNPWFTRTVYVCVFINAILVLFDKDGRQDSAQDQVILLVLDIITWIFFVEVVMMMVASGVWVRKIGFFNSKTNIVNFVLTALALYDFFQRRAWPEDDNRFRIVGVIARVTRLLRGFRTLAEIPSVRQLFDALQKSMSRLIDILILFVAFSLVIGLVGMQFFEKSMKYRCATPTWINCSFVESTEISCIDVRLPSRIGELSPVNNLTNNLYSSSSSSSGGPTTTTTFGADPTSILDPNQVSFIVNENALCQPTIAYTEVFNLAEAWSAVMLRQLTGSQDSLYTYITFPSIFVMNYFGAGGGGATDTSSIFFSGEDANNVDSDGQILTFSASENSTIARILVNESIVPLLRENSTKYQLPLQETNNANSLLHGVSCPYSQSCVPFRNPESDWISFDTVFPAFITMYFVTFLEGWSMIASFVMDARGTVSLYFFQFLVLAGALFMLNLVLAILVDAFTRSLTAIQARDASLAEERLKQIEEDRKEEEKKKKEKHQKKLQQAAGGASTNTNNNNNSSSNPNSPTAAIRDDASDDSSSVFHGGGGGGIGGLDFGDDDNNDKNKKDNNNNVNSIFSPANREDTLGPSDVANSNNKNTTSSSSSPTSMAAASRVLGFVRRKGQEIQKNREEEQQKDTSAEAAEKTKPSASVDTLSASNNSNNNSNNSKSKQLDRLDLLGGPVPIKDKDNNNTNTNVKATATKEDAVNSKLAKEKKRADRKADPSAPPVLGFRRQAAGSAGNNKKTERKQDNNNSQEMMGKDDDCPPPLDPAQSKKMLDIFEGDDPKQQSNLAYVGMVLSTSLALSGAAINSQNLKDQGCFKAFISKAKFYGRLIRFVVRSKIVSKTWFNVISAVLTFVNVVLLACVWHGMPEQAETGLFYATSSIALFFAIEITVKLIALPFVRLMRDVMNIVDLIVSVGSIIEFAASRSTVVTALRCIRILRLLSVIDSLRDTVKILRKGLVATIPLIIVLIIFLYFYAVVGMALFSGKLCLSAIPNRYSEVLDMFLRVPTSSCSSTDVTSADLVAQAQLADPSTSRIPLYPVAPAFNFDNFGNSLLSTFVVFIGDNWASLMALSMDRTSIFVSIWFISCFTIAGFIIVNLFVAAMIDACANPSRGDEYNNNDAGAGGEDALLGDGKGGALFGGGGGGPFHRRANMFLSPSGTPAKKKKGDKKNKKTVEKIKKKSSSSSSQQQQKDGEKKQKGSSEDENNSRDSDDDDDDDEQDPGETLLLRFKTITNLAASFRKRSNTLNSKNNSSRNSRTSSGMEDGLETTVFLGSPGSPDLRNFSALAGPSHGYNKSNNGSPSSRRTRGSSGIGGRLMNNQQQRHYRPVLVPGEDDDEFDMILDDTNPASPTSTAMPGSDPSSARNLSRMDSDLNDTLLQQSSNTLRTNSDLDASFSSFQNMKRRSIQLGDDEKRLTSAAAQNAQQRSKMTGAQRLQRLARRAVYGEKAFSAEQREEDKFGKIMLAASRVIGVEVNELSDFDRALLLPYFEEIRSARKFEEAKSVIRRWVGYMIRHPLYRIFSVIWGVFNVVMYVSLSNSFRPPDHPQNTFFAYTELFNAIIFNTDIMLQVVSVGFYTKQATRVTAGYFNSKLNVAKSIVGLFCIAASISSFVGTTDSTNALRIFSRVLPIWLYIPQHQPTMLIMISVFDALVSLGNVGFMAVLVWITYSIMGTQLFRGTFFACSSSPNEDTWGDQTYTGDRLYTRSACLNQSHYWVSYPHNFDNVWESMETLFGVATTDDWSTIAFLSVSARSHEEAPEPGFNMFVAIYTCSFILVAALFLLNVFIAVLVNAYFETQQRMERNIRHSLLLGEAGDLLDPQQRDFYDLYRRALCFVKKPPTARFEKGTVRWWIRRVSRANAFQLAILILTFTNVIVQFTAFTSAPPPQENLLIVDLVFTVILFIMISMKIVGSGLRAIVRESYWSIIEIIVVALNFSCVIAAIIFTFSPPVRFSSLDLENNLDVLGFLRQSRIFLLHRVMSATPGARVLVDTIVRSSQTLFSALLLLLLLFLSYSSIGLTLFGRVYGRDVHTNFWTIPRSMHTLLAVATFDGWQDVMSTSAARPPNCDPLIGDCGVAGASQLFFMSFIVLGQWVGISLFVAILVESFSRSERQERLRVQNEDVKRFRRMWKKHCRANMTISGDDATAASPMPITQLPVFLMELGAPLGPVSSRMVFADPDSRQTQLPEFPELKFAWALNAEKKVKEDLAKQQQQYNKDGDGRTITPPHTPRAHNNSATTAPSAPVLSKEDKHAAALFELEIPTPAMLWRQLQSKFTKIKTTATGTAVAVHASDVPVSSANFHGNSNANNNNPSSANFTNNAKSFTDQQQQSSKEIGERFATRSDAEKLLAKLNLPTFFDQSSGKRCVAQYSLFDALIRYYYGCALPPRTDLAIHEFLLSSFGVSRHEAVSQISKPSQRISSTNDSGLVIRKERGYSASRRPDNFKPPMPGASSTTEEEAARARRSLLGGVSATTFLDDKSFNRDLNDNKKGDDDDEEDDFFLPGAISKSRLERKDTSGFVEILSDDGTEAGTSRNPTQTRFRTKSLEPALSRTDIHDGYAIDQISVGAMFSVVRIQAIWRGARIRNKISRLAELATMGMNMKTEAEEEHSKKSNNNNNNDDDAAVVRASRSGSKKEDLVTRTNKILDSLPEDSSFSQAALTFRENPDADLAHVVDSSLRFEEENDMADDENNNSNNNLNKKTSSEDGGETEGGPPAKRKVSIMGNNNNRNSSSAFARAGGGGMSGGGGAHTLIAVAKLAGIIDRNRRRIGRKEIRGDQVTEEDRKIFSIKGANTTMRAAGKFAAVLNRHRSSSKPGQQVEPVKMKGSLGMSPTNADDDEEDHRKKEMEKTSRLQKTDEKNIFGDTYEVQGNSDDDNDNDEMEQSNNKNDSAQLATQMAGMVGEKEITTKATKPSSAPAVTFDDI